jgi:hypothetical protein
MVICESIRSAIRTDKNSNNPIYNLMNSTGMHKNSFEIVTWYRGLKDDEGHVVQLFSNDKTTMTDATMASL